jgi:hypothetical protein
MLIQKIFITTLTLLDPNEIIDPDIEKICKKHLERRFVGKNYMSCFVKSIDKILRTSPRIFTRQMDGGCNVDVEFEATCQIFVRGEIIPECYVLDIDRFNDATIVAENVAIVAKDSMIKTKSNDSVYVFTKDEHKKNPIPVIVQRVNYRANETEISVLGFPFIPIVRRNIVYKITNVAKYETHLSHLMSIQKKIKDEEKKVGKTKSYDFLEKLYYRFKSETLFSREGSQKGFVLKTVDMFEDAKNFKDGDLICITDELPVSIVKGQFYHSKGTTSSGKHELKDLDVIRVDLELVAAVILYRYYIELKNINSLCEVYPDIESAKRAKNVWQLYNQLKK